MKRRDIPVVILCGGRGTRLREETEIKPKPMVEIGGRPILWHIMRCYSYYGFRRFVLPLGYRGELIKNYFYNYRISSNDFTLTLDPGHPIRFHPREDVHEWEITCVDTGLETLKGGRVKRLEPFLDADRFHLTYGDGVSDVNIANLDKCHCSHDAIGTVTAVRPPSRFGELVIDGDTVESFVEKPQLESGFINGGFFVFDRKFLDYLTPDEDCDLEFGVLQKLSKAGELKVNRHTGFWQCMDNIREKEYLDKLWNSGNAPWHRQK